jgi:uncharacterized cofD-like protein
MHNDPYLHRGEPFHPDVICLTGGEGGRMISTTLQRTLLRYAMFYNPFDSGKRTGEHREPSTPVVEDESSPDYYHKVAAVGDGRRLIGSHISDPYIAGAWERDQRGGPADGLSLGNVFMDFVAREAEGDLALASKRICEIFRIPPILPITSTFAHLQGQWQVSGDRFFREHQIDSPGLNKSNRIDKVWLDRPVVLNPDFERMLVTTSKKIVVTIGPGSLFGSNLCMLKTDGITDVLDKDNIWIMYICNLATVPGETMGMSIRDHIDEVNSYLGSHKIDEVLVHDGTFRKETLAQYQEKGQEALIPRDEEFDGLKAIINVDNFLASNPIVPLEDMPAEQAKNIARHDSWKVTAKIDQRVMEFQRA